MKNILKTYDQLVELLHLLDARLLEGYGSQFEVVIQAVGGFALMYHNLRVDSKLSRDVDSIKELPAKVYRLAQEIDGSGWLNDDVSADYGIPKELFDNLVFVDSTFKFKCIRLQVAVLESIMAMKLHAIDNMTRRGYNRHTNPRTQDPKDVKDILHLYNVKNEQDFVREFPGLDCYVEKVYIADDEANTPVYVNIFEKYELFE